MSNGKNIVATRTKGARDETTRLVLTAEGGLVPGLWFRDHRVVACTLSVIIHVVSGTGSYTLQVCKTVQLKGKPLIKLLKRWGGNRYFPLTCALYKPVISTKQHCFTNLQCKPTSAEPGKVFRFRPDFPCFGPMYVYWTQCPPPP